MKLTKYSTNRLMATFAKWEVSKDFAEPMYNYLVHGFNPGSCFTSVLANDFYGAIQRSHPANTITAFKELTGWLHSEAPRESYGSYDAVSDWCYLPAEQRRFILEENNMIYTEQEEIMLILQNKYIKETTLY